MKPLIVADARTRLFNRSVDYFCLSHSSEPGPGLVTRTGTRSICYVDEEDEFHVEFDFISLEKYDQSRLAIGLWFHPDTYTDGHHVDAEKWLDYVFGPETSHDKVMFKMRYL